MGPFSPSLPKLCRKGRRRKKMSKELDVEEVSLYVTKLVVAAGDRADLPSWRLDENLREVEGAVLHGLGLPVEFADICLRASQADGVTDPAARLLLRLGQINGARRIAATSGEVAIVGSLFRDTKEEIAALPEHPRKQRLVSFWRYQYGVFANRNGYYAQAAEIQRQAAEEATNRAERAIALCLAQVYTLWDNMARGAPVAMDQLVLAYRELEQDTTGTAHEIQWGSGNGPIHLLQGYLWAGMEVPAELWDELFGKAKEAAARIPAFVEWAKALEVVSLVRGKQYIMAITRANNLIARSQDKTVVASSWLIKARILRDAGEFKAARELYDKIRPAPDCHQVAAVAARELATLPPA